MANEKIALYLTEDIYRIFSDKVDEIYRNYGIKTTIQQAIIADLRALYGLD